MESTSIKDAIFKNIQTLTFNPN